MNHPSATVTFPHSLSVLLSQSAAALAGRLQAMASPVGAGRAPRALALALEKNAVHAVARPQGRTITCESGALWLTFDHTLVDVVLEAGESHRCRADSRLLIQALEVSRLRCD